MSNRPSACHNKPVGWGRDEVMPKKGLVFKLLNGKYGVCRLTSTESIPHWFQSSEFFSITKTSEELSIVCHQSTIPDGVKCEKDWRILKIQGSLDFSLIGILAAISNTLAQQGISIFAISTYDTDYMLIKDKDLENAINALTYAGHEIRK